MKKLFTIVALAASMISAPAFARSPANNGTSYRQYQQQQGQDANTAWFDDQAKGAF